MEVEPQLQQPQMETPGMTLGPEEMPPVAPEGIPVAPSEAGDQAIASGGASGGTAERMEVDDEISPLQPIDAELMPRK
jgi:hypothetical protein